MKANKRKPVNRVLRNARKKGKNPLPAILTGLGLLLFVLAIAALSSKNSGQTTPQETETAQVPDSDIKEVSTEAAPKVVKAEKPSVKQPETEIVNYNQIQVEGLPQQQADLTNEKDIFQDLKLDVRQLALEKKWDVAFQMINDYVGPYEAEIGLLKKELEAKQSQFNELASQERSVEVQKDAPIIAKVEKKEMDKPVALAKPKAPEKKVISFPKESKSDISKQKKGKKSVTLIPHSRMVGLSNDSIVVWKERSKVLSYSRLIRNIAVNKSSKFYQQRVEKAKKFLADNRDYWEPIKYRQAKMTLRTGGFTVSDVFFNMSTVDKEYGNKTTERFKGFIISYDIKPVTVVGFSMGC